MQKHCLAYNEPMPTSEQVTEALKAVTDPEIGINIVDLGLVYEVHVEGENEVKIIYTLTSMGCPAGPMIDTDIKETVAHMEGVDRVQTEVVMQPPWSPEKMSEFAKSALGFF